MEAEERRSCARERRLLRAKLLCEGQPISDCMILNVSRQGARILLAGSSRLSGGYQLHIPGRNLTLRGHVVWQDRDQAGLAFDDEPQAPVSAGELLELEQLSAQLEALDRELRGLRQVVDDLRIGRPGVRQERS